MSFNWRLLLAPAEILDYVVEHEVVHLEVMDHSQRFWQLLAARVPDWREHERWLRRHGHAAAPAERYSQRKKRTAANRAGERPAGHDQRGDAEVRAAAGERGREPVDHVRQRQRLRDRLQHRRAGRRTSRRRPEMKISGRKTAFV